MDFNDNSSRTGGPQSVERGGLQNEFARGPGLPKMAALLRELDFNAQSRTNEYRDDVRERGEHTRTSRAL